MIKFSLQCSDGHLFEAWFRDSSSYEEQKEADAVTCPVCHTANVEKALMAPRLGAASVGKRTVQEAQTVFQPSPEQNQARDMLRKLREHVIENADYVGKKFADEARRIHFDEAKSRGIYGETTREEVNALHEDGIEVFPLPTLPEDQN